MKIELGCPTTIGEYNRLVKNLEVYKRINEEQKDWLVKFMDNNKYQFKKVVLQLDDDNVLWVIINTKNSVRQYERWE